MERQKVRVTKHHSVAEDLLDSAQVGSGIFFQEKKWYYLGNRLGTDEF